MSYINPAVAFDTRTAVVYLPGQSDPPLMKKEFPDATALDAATERWESRRGQGHPTYFSWITVSADHVLADLFSPSVQHIALKIENVWERIWMVPFYGVCDLLTLPIRIVTFVLGYRTASSVKKEDHPLYQDLIASGVAQDVLAVDNVRVSIFHLRKEKGWDKTILEATTKTISLKGTEDYSGEGHFTTCVVKTEEQAQKIQSAHLGNF